MSDLMVLLEESLLLLTNSSTAPLDEVEGLIVQQRTLVDEQRRSLMVHLGVFSEFLALCYSLQ